MPIQSKPNGREQGKDGVFNREWTRIKDGRRYETWENVGKYGKKLKDKRKTQILNREWTLMDANEEKKKSERKDGLCELLMDAKEEKGVKKGKGIV